MAREKMVTRTVSATVVKVMCVNVTEQTAFTTEVTLTGTYKDNADILKTLRKSDSKEQTHVAIISTEVKETLYGMTEGEFMKYAKQLPPRKVYEQ